MTLEEELAKLNRDLPRRKRLAAMGAAKDRKRVVALAVDDLKRHCRDVALRLFKRPQSTESDDQAQR